MEKERNNGESVERLMKKMGDFGRYQCLQYTLQVLSALPTGMHLLSLVTIDAVPEHRCAIEGVDTTNHTELWNSSLVQNAIPLNTYGNLDSCQMYGENNTLIQCNSWVYDTQYYSSSRGIEWNFVCNRRSLSAVVQTIFMIGVVLGSLVLGPLSDKFGRKTVFLWTSTLQLLCATTVAFTTDYYWFIGLRFLLGIFAVSPFKAGYVLTIELVGPSKRAVCSALFQILFGTGVALIGFWGYFINHNRFHLQLVYALHSALLLPHLFLLDESPRWLWSQGREVEALAIVKKAIKMNNCSDKMDSSILISNTKITSKTSEIKSSGILDLFGSANMIKRSLIMSGCWFATGLVYYGLALNTGSLPGNPSLLMCFGGLLELPGYAIGMFCVHKFGHRAILIASMFISGMSCVIVVFLPYGSVLTTAAALLGKCVICATYATIYKYSAELFPTVVRSSAVAFGTMCASVSAAAAPLITLLDSFDPIIPTVIFGLLALIFGSFALLLPETRGRNLPQSLEDGERFGVGDNCFTSCRGRHAIDDSIESLESKEPLNVPENI